MIDHFAIYDIHTLTDRFGLAEGVPKGVKPRYNLAPTEPAPIILEQGGSTVLRTMNWGLVSEGSRDFNSVYRYKTHTVKSEKVFLKKSWDNAIRTRRCIIPANGFFMQRRGENNDTYYFSAAESYLLSIAGFYSSWTDSTGKQIETFTMLTIQSNGAMPLPFATMPVLLHPDDEATWIKQDMSEFSTIVRAMRPYEGAPLRYYKVPASLNVAKNDTAELLRP